MCCAQKKGYWWLFPQFDNEEPTGGLSNSSSNQPNYYGLDVGNATDNDLRSSHTLLKNKDVYRDDRDIKRNLIEDEDVVETFVIGDTQRSDKDNEDKLQSDAEWNKVDDDGSGQTISPDDEDETSDRDRPILYNGPEAMEKTGPVSGTAGGHGREIFKTEDSPAKKDVDKKASKGPNPLHNDSSDDDDVEAAVEGSGNGAEGENEENIIRSSQEKSGPKSTELLAEIEGSGNGEFDAKDRFRLPTARRDFNSEVDTHSLTDDFEFDGDDGEPVDVPEPIFREDSEGEKENDPSYTEDGDERDVSEPNEAKETENEEETEDIEKEMENSNSFDPTIVINLNLLCLKNNSIFHNCFKLDINRFLCSPQIRLLIVII